MAVSPHKVRPLQMNELLCLEWTAVLRPHHMLPLNSHWLLFILLWSLACVGVF